MCSHGHSADILRQQSTEKLDTEHQRAHHTTHREHIMHQKRMEQCDVVNEGNYSQGVWPEGGYCQSREMQWGDDGHNRRVANLILISYIWPELQLLYQCRTLNRPAHKQCASGVPLV